MKTNSKISYWICVLLAILNLLWLTYDTFIYAGFPESFNMPGVYTDLVTISMRVFLVSHLMIITMTIFSLKSSKKFTRAGSILIVLGFISIVALLVHYLSYDQLWEDFEYHDPYKGMRNIAFISESIIISFFIFSLIYFFMLARKRNSDTYESIFRERIFVALNFTGVVCSVVGLLFVWFDFKLLDDMDKNINAMYPIRNFDLIPFAAIALPYLCVLAGWGISCYRDKRYGWYDEKQSFDVNRSAMIALTSLLPLIIGLIIHSFLNSGQIYVSGTVPVLWLLFYLFGILLIFSATALYRFKKS